MRSIRVLPSIPHDTRFETANEFNYAYKQCVNNNTYKYQLTEKKEEKNKDDGTDEQSGN